MTALDWQVGSKAAWGRAGVWLLLMAACEGAPPPERERAQDPDAERARIVQCCQGLVHEAWNSDPPNPHVLHAARACEFLARQGRIDEALDTLSAAGHSTTCDRCPPNGCRP